MVKIILNADDFGKSVERNRAIDDSFKQRLIRSAGLIVTGKHLQEAVNYMDKGGYVENIHLHMNLSTNLLHEDSDDIPLTEAMRKDAFFCKDGKFKKYNGLPQRFSDIRKWRIVYQELVAQYNKFVEVTNGKADYKHIDFHLWYNLTWPVSVALRLFTKRFNIESVRYIAIHQTQMAVSRRGRKDTNAEELRLLYVAMTRAIDRLWMVVRCKDRDKALHGAALSLIPSQGRKDRAPFPYAVSSAGHMSDWLLFVCLLHPDAYGLREHSGLALLPSQSEGRLHVVMGDIPEPLTEEPAAPDGESMDFSPYLDFEYPYRNILNFEAKYSVSQLAKADRADVGACRSRPAFVTGDRLTPAEKGTATHRFMCFADYDRARVSVQTEINRLVAEGRLTPAQGEGIDVATVEAFFDSDLYRRVQAADRVLKESRFLYEMPVRRLDPDCDSDETVVVQGVADLVLFEADGVTIVDFKTDRGCTPEGLKEKYTRQLAVYADAFSVDYHLPKKTPYLYSFFLRQAVPLPEALTNSKKI